MTTRTTQSPIPSGAINRTVPNQGLTVVYTTDYGAAFRCLACNAGTAAGNYDLPKTRTAARWHREDSCPHPDAHHITAVVMATQKLDFVIPGRRRRQPTESVTYPIASCVCGWTQAGEDGDRESGRRLARAHRDSAHRAWLEGRALATRRI
jgi:hypothetical protein